MNRAQQFDSSPRHLSAAVAGLVIMAFAAHADNPNSIIYSKHNLSVSSPGTVHATTESDVCIFCHTPHGASATDGPLWNHQMSTATYTPFSSPTLTALNVTIGQPNGSSRLCLSCHDGTVALGLVGSRPGGIAMNTAAVSGLNNLTINLSSDHPISFTYDSALATAASAYPAAGGLVDPGTLPPEVALDRNNQLQCTTCHDPHNDQYGNFLVMDNTSSALCLVCHSLPGWSGSVHAISSKLLPVSLAVQVAASKGGIQSKTAASVDSVAHTACASCHVPHAAGAKQALTRFSTPEKNCVDCHAGDGPGKNISAEFTKISIHPIMMTSGIHDPTEDIINSPRHVACEDCHNPHAIQSAGVAPVAPAAPAALTGVRGVNAAGVEVRQIQNEYELCFRCHADSANRGPSHVQRQFAETNKRLQFSLGNASFHPVEDVGKNPTVPSLVLPWTLSSKVYCTDCHNNELGAKAGGGGPNGPHGSAFTPLLERTLLLTDGQMEDASLYELCYKCHDRNNILGDASFVTVSPLDRGHRYHIVDQKTACTTCHDSHGVATQAKLINFNTAYVTPSSNGRLEYVSAGPLHGNCSVTCHGYDHKATAY